MDSLTHIALGACMGEAFAGRKLGRKAMLWGVLAQSIPDVDFIAAFWLDPASNLLAHRGFTHSLVFCGLITLLLSLLAEYWHRPHNISFPKWLLFFGGVIFAHIFIDAFNGYGVGWFEPFSHQRISFDILYVADPLFSLWPGIGCLLLIAGRRQGRFRKIYWKSALAMSTLYLIYCIGNKQQMDSAVKTALEKQHIRYKQYFTTPAPLQNWLWYIVAEDNNGYYIGFHSVFDRSDNITLRYFPRNAYLLQPVADHQDVQKLIRFSRQFYTVEKWGDTLVFNDLRFGQIVGWDNPNGKFVFQYYLKHGTDNTLVVQRGRFIGWNRASLHSFWKRIKGD